MKNNLEPGVLKLARQCIRTSFIGGTTLFVAFIMTKEDALLPVGLLFTLIAGLSNGFILLALLLHWFKCVLYRAKILITAILMLCNLPVVALYAFIAINSHSVKL